MDSAAKAAVVKTAYVVLAQAKLEVPLDEGILMRSGMVLVSPREALALIIFGGGAGTGMPVIAYAVRWHEVQARFQHGRKYRYLVDPYSRLAKPVLKKALRMEAKRRGL